MELQELQRLISKYNNNTATTEERALVEKWYDGIEGDDADLTEKDLAGAKQEIHARLNAFIEKGTSTAEPIVLNRKNSFARYGVWFAAAMLLLAIGVSFYFYKQNTVQQNAEIKPTQLLKNDIAPGGNQAVLTLADGSKIVMSKKDNGRIATQGNTQIEKADDGQLIYDASAPAAIPLAEVKYNLFSTPRGGKYEIVLSDGTKVYLNAASSIRYPTAFVGKERNVELTGEAYFEVAKNKDMPFKVSCAGQEVKVLGTHFNINAYSNEPSVKTTLLEGSVQISKGTNHELLRPGEQALIANGGSDIVINKNINVDEVVAWKNGLFQFDAADVSTIMRQISRWYDVDVEFVGDVPGGTFHGKIPRNVNASQVLQILEQSGIKLKIEGRKIIVK